MKKNQLINLTIVALLSLVTASVNNEVTNATAQAKTSHITKKTHKKATKKTAKKVTKKHTKKTPAKNVKSSHTTNTNTSTSNDNQTNHIVDGYNTKTQKIVDMNTYINTATQTAINKLNEFRQNNGLSTLSVDSGLTKIAQMRAQQTAAQNVNASHYNAQGQFMGALDAQTLNVMSYDEANNSIYENIGVYGTDTSDFAKSLGNQAIQDEIDEGPTGGHYKNDLTPSLTKCGLAFYVNNEGNIGYALDMQ